MKHKEQVHCRWSSFPLAGEAAPTCFPCLDALGTHQCSGSEEQAAPQHRRYFSTTVSKAIWFFKVLGGEALSTHSSSNSAGPQENKAADTWLCVMLPQHNSSIFLKTIKLSERTQITEVSGTEAIPLHPWHNPSGEHWFDWRTRADSWEGNKEVSISVIYEFLLADGICWLLCSSSAWQRVRNPWQSSCFLEHVASSF